jgi:hypothetical protein
VPIVVVSREDFESMHEGDWLSIAPDGTVTRIAKAQS